MGWVRPNDQGVGVQRDALYFPYVHIRDDDWLKVAALYWPTVRRLVPAGYQKHDSPTALVFADAQLLTDEDPAGLLSAVSWDLINYLRRNVDALAQNFSVERAQADWDGGNWAERIGQPFDVASLGWIHVTKFPRNAVRYLERAGLARVGRHEAYPSPDPGRPGEWVGMHPALAGAYMTALARQLGEQAHFEPLTDQADLRVATPSSDVRAAIRLLSGGEGSHGNLDAGVDTYVMLALQHARPKNLQSLPADKIVECRAKLGEELIAFRDYVASRQAELTELASIPIRARRFEAFAADVQQTIEVPLQRLERALALHKLEPSRSLLMMGSLVPPAAVGAAVEAFDSPVIAASSGIVIAVGNAWWQVRQHRGGVRRSSPVGYLLDVRDHLTPKTLATRVRKVIRGTYDSSKSH
jgi:hypothetical protein